MINGFKLTKRLYAFVLVPVAIVIAVGITILTDKVFLSVAIAIVLLLIGALGLEILARKRYFAKCSLLTEDCDPEAYRDFLIEVLSNKISKDTRLEVQLNLSYAHYHCGDFEQMKNILEALDLRQLKSKKENLKYESLKFEYYNMWLFYFLKFDDLESAEKVLNDIDEWFLNSHEMVRNLKEGNVRTAHFSVESRKGEIPRIEEKVFQYVSTDKPFYKVSDKNFLGKYYLRFGMTDKAKECFEFVAKHGNKLYMVKEAESILRDL